MICQAVDAIVKGQTETKPIKVQFPQVGGTYPVEPPIITHNANGFALGAVSYNSTTGLATFNLLPTSVLFNAPVKFKAVTQYPDGSVATWLDFMQVIVVFSYF
jgi:hypothetical protein